MRSPVEHGLRIMRSRALCALLLSVVLWGPMCVLAANEHPSEAQVSAALEKLEHDPNLASTREVKLLRFAKSQRQQEASDAPPWMQPFIRFFEWLIEGVRYIVWVACVVLVGIIVMAQSVAKVEEKL